MTKLVDQDWLSAAPTQAVCKALTDAGYQALFVGGCVRNALLGAPVSDIDISTNAHPDIVMDVAKGAGLKSIPTGIEHGTITVISGGIAHEITTFRKDVATDGRRAVVAFADTIEEDAQRRDFTMNALFADATGQVLDPLDGLSDLKARRVKFIGHAQDRIREDYLRILRFFRFHAWYGDQQNGLDADGLAACAGSLDGIASLSGERLGAETLKLLGAPEPGTAIGAMAQSGVLAAVLPGSDAKALPVLVHLEATADQSPDPLRRLAVLGGTDTAARLRLSRKQARELSDLRNGISSMDGAGALGFAHGADLATSILLLRAALFETPLSHNWQALVKNGAEAIFPVRAADLPADLAGPAIGQALKQLQAVWVESNFALEKDALLAHLDR